MIAKRSDEKMPYLKGWIFWQANAFWRSPMYSKKVQEMYEKDLEQMRARERQLTRLS